LEGEHRYHWDYPVQQNLWVRPTILCQQKTFPKGIEPFTIGNVLCWQERIEASPFPFYSLTFPFSQKKNKDTPARKKRKSASKGNERAGPRCNRTKENQNHYFPSFHVDFLFHFYPKGKKKANVEEKENGFGPSWITTLAALSFPALDLFFIFNM
jgi:hypothetical protein